MKPHYTDAPFETREKLLRVQAATTRTSKSAANGWIKLIEAARHYGFRVDPADIPQPATARYQDLLGRASTDPEASAELRRTRLELLKEARNEERALARVNALKTWAAGPSRDEEKAQAAARAEAEKREQAINERAAEIVAQTQAKAIEAARKQAAKELGQ